MSPTHHRPRLGFGGVGLGGVSGGRTWRSDVRLVHEAVDRGVTLFDTADAYGNGMSERVLGRALRGRRSEVQIATKSGYLFDERSMLGQSVRSTVLPLVVATRARLGGRGPAADVASSGAGSGGGSYERQDFSAPSLRRAVDASLRRLETDHIDVFQLHGPRQVHPELRPLIDDLIRSGKILRFGIGAESVASAKEWLLDGPVDVLQVPFGMMDPQAATELFPSRGTSGAEFWVRGVLGGGVLASVGRPGTTVDRHPKWPLISALKTIADDAGLTLFQIAIDYVRSFGDDVAADLIGIRSSEHLADNLRLMDAPAADAAVLDRVRTTIDDWARSNDQT